MDLTADELALLALERRTYRHAGAKVTAVRAELGLTETAYYQRLGQVIDRPEALAVDPMLVNRLRRLRDTRRARRRAVSV